MCVTSWCMWPTSTMDKEPYKRWILPPNSQHRCQHSYLKSLLVELEYFRSCLACQKLSSSKMKKSCLLLNAKLSILECLLHCQMYSAKTSMKLTFHLSTPHSLCSSHIFRMTLYTGIAFLMAAGVPWFSTLIVLLRKQKNKSLAGHLVLLFLFLLGFILCDGMLSLKTRKCFSQQSLFKYNFITWSCWKQGLSHGSCQPWWTHMA